MDAAGPVVRTTGGLVRGRWAANQRAPGPGVPDWSAVDRSAVDRSAADRSAAAQGVPERGDPIAVFRGIPFGRPPVGDLRFAAPVPARPWDGVREAAAFGPPPPQSGLQLTPLAPPAPGADSADWLTVNVFSPDLGAARLPVLAWIYGGVYRFGASGQLGFDGVPIASRNVVVVTFNYRVGVEGYAYLPGVPANRALLDQVAALHWVRENIAAFGGDPDLVTVFGESAGAGAIASLFVMPAAAGLFRRAIAQSIPGTFFSPELAADVTAAIAAKAGLPATAEAFAAADPARLAIASDAVYPGDHLDRWGPVAHTTSPFSPVVDGEVLPAAPWRAVAAGAGRSIDLIAGHNRDEYRLFTRMPGQFGRITAERADQALRALAPSSPSTDGAAAYREAFPEADAGTLFELVQSDFLFRMPTLHFAQAHAAAGGRTFLYELSYPARPVGMGACHALDVPLVFGVYAGLGRVLFGPRPPESAVRLGNLMRSQWAAFAADGDPGWPQYSPGHRTTRIFDDPPDVVPYPETESMHIWDQHRFDVLDLDAAPAPDLAYSADRQLDPDPAYGADRHPDADLDLA